LFFTRSPYQSVLNAFATDPEKEARGYLREYCSEIFEEQLDSWYRVPSAWPVDRTFDTFNRWFEFRFHSMLVDLCDEPAMRDER